MYAQEYCEEIFSLVREDREERTSGVPVIVPTVNAFPVREDREERTSGVPVIVPTVNAG